MGYTKRNFTTIPDFIIYKHGSTITAKSGSSGNSTYNGTDFATVIQSAIDYCDVNLHGGYIKIKQGEYDVSTTITVPHGIRISGCNKAHNYGMTELDLENSVDADMFVFNEGYNTIDNIKLEGNNTNNTAGSGIYMDNAVTGGRSTISEVVVTNFEDHNIDIENGSETVLYSVLSKGSNGNGFNLVSAHGGSGNVGATLLEASGNAGHGLYSAMGALVSSSYFAGNTEAGVVMGQGTLSSCSIRNNTGTSNNAQIWTGGLDEAIIVGNKIDCLSATNYGINVHNNSDDCVIQGNAIFDYNTSAINVGTGARNIYNGLGTESANAEEPQLTWQTGVIVDFTDSGDASGDGFYILDAAGNWQKLA